MGANYDELFKKYHLTEIEIKELEEIINSGYVENHYQALGLKIFGDYHRDNYTNRIAYIDGEVKERDRESCDKIKKIINIANPVLSHPQKKRIYDEELKLANEKKLIDIIKLFVEKDKEMDKEERESVEEKGKSFGFKPNEIQKIVEEQKNKLGFEEINLSKNAQNASTFTTLSGVPKLEITNNSTYKQKGEFVFDNVKLTETQEEKITIFNGGGGTLDASAIRSKKWIEVVPKKIHQSNLPQDVTIIINPSKDPSLKNGAKTMDTLNLTYASGPNTVSFPIDITLSIEGHDSLVDRLSGYAALIAGAIVLFTLIYIFNIYHFSGRAISGFVVSAIAIGIGLLYGLKETNKNKLFKYIIPGEVILLITNWIIFLLVSTITITWYLAKIFFRKYTFRNEFILIIPVFSFLLFLVVLFNFSNINFYNTSYQKPNLTNSSNVNNSKILNKTGYINVKSIANIRNGPSTSFDIISTKKNGETVIVLEKVLSKSWYKVHYNNNDSIGYIHKNLVSFDITRDKQNIEPFSTTDSSGKDTSQIRKAKQIIEKPEDLQGKIDRSNGRVYEGKLKNGKPHGDGVETFPDNSKFIGRWLEGKRHGNFLYIEPDGDTIRQVFKEGIRIK